MDVGAFAAELAKIDQQLEATCILNHIPGLSAVLVQGQEPIWMKSWGFANLEQGRPTTPDTLYRIASVTKLFTATMLMQLHERGHLQLDEPVDRYISAFHHLSQGTPITFRHLVSHTSGLPMMPPTINRFLPKPFAELTHEDLPQLRYPTLADIVASLPETTLLFSPGTQCCYSNFGVALLAHAMAQIVQQPYEQYVKSHILQPLAMQRSAFALDHELSKTMATGYYAWDGSTQQVVPNHSMGGFTSTGGLHSSANDMVRFLLLHLNAAEESRVLSSQMVQQMFIPILEIEKARYVASGGRGGIATGWFCSSLEGFPVVEHGGGDFPFSTFLALVPSVKLGIFIATNTGSATRVVAQLAYQILGALLRVHDAPD